MNRKRARPDRPESSEESEDEKDAQLLSMEVEEEQVVEEMEENWRRGKSAASSSQRRKLHESEVKECGCIDRVELVNFMCHKYLEVRLGPRINFIIGHNGSGKSAILTAITVCLGGKAQATQRAASLKGLIREGEAAAEVTLRIRNGGPDPFKHDLYGDYITVVRRLSKDGASTYKLKSSDGKVVSNKKEELTAMCDFMAIQPDNPLLILSQDAARQFLASSTAEERYKLFLRGTQLQQLSEDYAHVRENIEKLATSLRQKQAVLKDYKRERQLAERRLREMEAALNLEQKLEELKQHMAWSQVHDMVETLQPIQEEHAHLQQNLQTVQESLDQTRQQIADYDRTIAELEQEMREVNEREQLVKQEMECKMREIQDVQERIRQITREEREINESVKSKKKELEMFDQKILESMNRLAGGDEVVKQRQSRLNHLMAEMREIQSDLHSAPPETSHTEEHLHELEREGRASENTVRSLRSELQRLRSAGDAQASVYGERVQEMLREIETKAQSGRYFAGGKPIGPFGMHIKLKSAKYAQPMDAVFGANMCYAFAVQNPRDIRPLQQIFEKYKYGPLDRAGRLQTVDIFSAQLDSSFDEHGGEPDVDPRWTTILRELEIRNPLVKQVLINNYNIEAIILVDSRRQGEEIMSRQPWPRNVASCMDLQANRIGRRGGGQATFSMFRRVDKGITAFCGMDQIQFVAQLQRRLQEEEHKLNDIQQRYRDARHQVEERRQEMQTFRQRRQASEMRKRNVGMEIEQIEEELENFRASTDNSIIEQLEHEKKECEKEIELLRQQFPNIFSARQQYSAQNRQLTEELNPIREQLEEYHNQKAPMLQRQDEMTNEKQQLRNNIVHYEKQVDRYSGKIAKSQVDIDKLNSEIADAERMALEICHDRRLERAELQGNTEHLERELCATTARLREREEEMGSVEEAMRVFSDKNDKAERAEKDVNETKALLTQLSNELNTRQHRWILFRDSITYRSKIHFVYLLEHRNFSGSLEFDHRTARLEVKIQTNEGEIQLSQIDNSQSKKRKDNDPRALSGGEKSFSTICLLMALWETMGSPIRALDEFDVFMDSVNRRVSMTLMIDSGRANEHTQYILITPQAMDHVKLGPDIKVIKLDDPKRRWEGGQRTLDNRS